MAEDTGATPGALDGLRVVEVGLLVQGPQAAALLAQMGASVIKVELPGIGDLSRWVTLGADDGRSAYFQACNRGKRSLTLDLRRPEGQDVLRTLVRSADVLLTNFQPGTMEGWGLGYEDLREVNPGLIFATASAFGSRGPDADRAGADLSAQAAGGLASALGNDGEPPNTVPVTIADHIGSLNLVAGILAALVARGRTGTGQQVEVSLLGTQIWAQASEYTAHFLTGELPGRANRAHPLLAGIYGLFSTADGWLAIVGVTLPDRPRLFEALGRPDLSGEERFLAPFLDKATRAELFPLLDEAFAQRTTQEWSEVLRDLTIRYAPVRSYAEVAADEQVWANGYLACEPDDPERRIVGSPIGLSQHPLSVGAPAPELGQHTEEVLLEAGYGWDEIARWSDQGVI